MLLQNSISAEVANGLRSLGHFLHDFCNLGPRPRRVIWGEFCLFVYLFGGGGVGGGEWEKGGRYNHLSGGGGVGEWGEDWGLYF